LNNESKQEKICRTSSVKGVFDNSDIYQWLGVFGLVKKQLGFWTSFAVDGGIFFISKRISKYRYFWFSKEIYV
jgi:hypothetical protein